MRFGLAGVPEYLFSLFARVVCGEGVVAVKLRVKELLSSLSKKKYYHTIVACIFAF